MMTARRTLTTRKILISEYSPHVVATIPRTSFCSRSRVISWPELSDATIPSSSYRSTTTSDDSRPQPGARKHAALGCDPGGRRPSVHLSQDGDRTGWREPSQSRRHGAGRGPRGATPGLWTVEPSLPDQPENPLARGRTPGPRVLGPQGCPGGGPPRQDPGTGRTDQCLPRYPCRG